MKNENDYSKPLFWLLETCSNNYELKIKLRSILQKELKYNAKELHRRFKAVSKLQDLRWNMIVFLRKAGERDFSVCKKITSKIRKLKISIGELESIQRFKKKLLRELN